MGQIIKSSSFQRAEIILAMMNQIMPPDEESPNLITQALSAGQVSGFHIVNIYNQRACNIAGCKVTDGYQIVYGDNSYFDVHTCLANDNARLQYFDRERSYQAAEFAVNWLLGKL